MTYQFELRVNSDKLQREILAISSIASTLSSIEGSETSTIVHTNRTLTDPEYQTLLLTVQNHNAVDAQADMKTRILRAMEFGADLIAEIGAENVLAGYTTLETQLIVTKYAPIINLLLTGSLKTALEKIELLVPDLLVTPERIRKYGNKIRAYLGMPLL